MIAEELKLIVTIAMLDTFSTWNSDKNKNKATKRMFNRNKYENNIKFLSKLTRNPYLRFPRVCPPVGRSMPWLILRELKTSVDELRTGSEKYKYTFKFLWLLVACNVLVSLLSSSSFSGTWVLRLTNTLLLSAETNHQSKELSWGKTYCNKQTFFNHKKREIISKIFSNY